MNPGDLVAGRYRLVRPIGVGGMGCVWAARHEGIDREVALKIPEGRHADNPELRSRFLAEARALGRLRHPNIVDVLDSGKLDDGRLFIAFEMLDGAGLDTYLHESGRLRAADAVKIAIELCRGLEFAHQAGVIHRDLKPANVYLHQSPGGGMLVKLLDFGISKTLDDGVSTSLTHTGNVVGTPLYMSPEQARGDSLDHRSDLWNVGVLLYEMLAGLAPFEGKSFSATVAKIVSEDAPPLATWGVFAVPELEALITKCLSRERELRHASAAELRSALEEILPLVKNATPPRMSIASLVDSLPSLPPPPPSVSLSAEVRAFPADAPTLPPPSLPPGSSPPRSSPPGSSPMPASSLRPTTSSFAAATPPPANITVHSPVLAPKRPWHVLAAAAGGVLLVSGLVTFLSLRSPSPVAAPAAAPPEAAASPTIEQRVSPLVPAEPEAAALDAGNADAAEAAPSVRAADEIKTPQPPKPSRPDKAHKGPTKVDDPGF